MILTDVKWKSLLCGILILVSFVFLKPFPAWAGTDGTNNDAATAIEITAGQQVSTSIDYSSDQDWYKITVDQACSLYTTLTNNSGAIFYSILNYSQSQLSTKLCSTGTSNHYWKVTPGTYYIQISNLSGVNYTTSSISFNVTLRGEDQWENNNTSANAVQISSGQQYSNISIEAVNDNDWFKITVDHVSGIQGWQRRVETGQIGMV